MRWLPVIAFALIGCNELPEALDMSLSAEEGKDVTAIFEGCQKKTDGYLFCRILEESTAEREIKLHFPKVDCDRDNCAEIQFLNLDGSLGFAMGVPKGSTEAAFKLSDVISAGTVDRVHDGEYRVLARIWYKAADQVQRQTRFSGVFRLWVVKKTYQTLVCNDPERGWSKKLGTDCRAEYSTNMRTSLCGGCK